jgi:hypothetical protein
MNPQEPIIKGEGIEGEAEFDWTENTEGDLGNSSIPIR